MALFKIIILMCCAIIFGCKNSNAAMVAPNGEEYVFPSTRDFSSFMSEHVDPNKKILLYVNGKGPEPTRSQISVIPYIEKHYDVQVCMFRWPSFGWIVGYPLESAQNSAKSLQNCLQNMSVYLRENPRRCSLFVHSMGNIVLKNYIEKYKGNLPMDMFDNVILNAADTDFAGHVTWVNKIDFAKRIYITYSRCDRVLRLSQIFKNYGKLRLGQGGFSEKSSAIYVDFTKGTGIYHEYFRGPSPQRKVGIRQFFYEAFHGEKVSMHFFDQVTHNHFSLF